MKWEQEDIIEFLIDSYCSHYNHYHHFQRNDDEVDMAYESAICDYIFETLQTITGGTPGDVADMIDEVLEGIFLFDPQAKQTEWPILPNTVVYTAQDICYSDLDSFKASLDEEDFNWLAEEVFEIDYNNKLVWIPKGTKMTFKGVDNTCSGWPTFEIHGEDFDFAGDPFKLKRYPGE